MYTSCTLLIMYQPVIKSFMNIHVHIQYYVGEWIERIIAFNIITKMIYHESDCLDHCCCGQTSMTKDKNYIYNFSNVPVHIHIHVHTM